MILSQIILSILNLKIISLTVTILFLHSLNYPKALNENKLNILLIKLGDFGLSKCLRTKEDCLQVFSLNINTNHF